MRRLRRSLLALIVLLFLFYNAQRLHFEEDVNPIDLQNFVYLLGFIIVVVSITVPVAKRVSTPIALVFWSGVYFLCKLVVFRQDVRPLLGDYHVYISITELAFAALTVILARNLAFDLHDFETTVENITLTDIGGRLSELKEAENEMQREVMRSRRYQRPLSVIIVEPDPTSLRASLQRSAQEVQQTLIKRYVVTSLGHVISQALRRTDMLAEQTERERFVILCPEMDPVAAQELIKRIQFIAEKRLGVRVMCGVGSFPNVPTLNELMRRAEGNLQHQDQLPSIPIMEGTESQG